MNRPQTIQIFLPSGDPQGIRIASVPTRTVQVFDVPRKLLADFLKRPEAEHVGVYYLAGNDDHDNDQAYVGQSGNLAKRLANHSSYKDFWSRAFIAVSLTNAWTQTHIAYLEWESIRQVQAAGRMTLENGNTGSRPHTPEPMLADCEEYLETIKMLLATLSFPLLEPVKRGVAKDSATPTDDGVRVRLNGRGCKAEGVYSTDGLLVLAGAKGRYLEPQPGSSYVGGHANKVRELADEGVIQINEDGTTLFLREYLFKTPSGAATTLYSSTANGRVEWRDESGSTIADIEAQALEMETGDDDE